VAEADSNAFLESMNDSTASPTLQVDSFMSFEFLQIFFNLYRKCQEIFFLNFFFREGINSSFGGSWNATGDEVCGKTIGNFREHNPVICKKVLPYFPKPSVTQSLGVSLLLLFVDGKHDCESCCGSDYSKCLCGIIYEYLLLVFSKSPSFAR
jgi:hypothetical protein